MPNVLFRLRKALIFFITNFIPFTETRRSIRDRVMLKQFHSKKYAFENNTKFKNYLNAVAIIKNEAPYLREWIEYHRILGIEKFYIYDDASTDKPFDVLAKYIDAGIVIYEKVYRNPKKNLTDVQRKIYTKAVRRYKNKTRWLAIFDIDEFFVPLKHNSIVEFLKEYEEFSQIIIHWKMFGSSGHTAKPAGLVIENYNYSHEDVHLTGKSIVNPRAILRQAEVHYSKVIGMPVDERKHLYPQDPSVIGATADIMCINHYWSKSEEEFVSRRGYLASDVLKKFDAQAVKFDDSIKRFIPAVKKALANN